MFRPHPEFIAQIARIAGAGDGDGEIVDGAVGEMEVGQFGEIDAADDLLQDGPAARPLNGQRRQIVADVDHLSVEAIADVLEPAAAGIGRGDAEMVGVQSRHGAVVDDLAVGVAPGGVIDLADFLFGDIAGDDPIDEAGGVGAGDLILEQGGDVDQRRAVADGVIFPVMGHLVDARRQEAGPVSPFITIADGRRPGVERGR